jgi:hypothetical protein
MGKHERVKVASIHTHFNIFRNVNEPGAGDVTIAEQIKAMERFTRWHERQVQVGRELLDSLRRVAVAEALAAETETPAPAAEPSA